ncbi:MAG: FAD-binding oxidoreductase [Rhodospirillales bacterium]|nr:FAD-binding oxidoreductase [Rhodospirillales bacterium]
MTTREAPHVDAVLPPGVLEALQAAVGAKAVIVAADALEPYRIEERGLFRGTCAAVVQPATTEEVAAVVRLCAAEGVPIVPHGGNTGLVGGGVPRGGIVLSTARLNKIRGLDAANRTITVEAGVILADVQRAADEADALFPLSLAAEGSCRIGGNLATNAGGIAVLRYGNARDLVLGLEVVLADGRILSSLSGLRKDNTGYDLKQLFIGSEGTLGVITAAVLKLFARPKVSVTALAALGSVEAAVALFQHCNAAAGDSLSAFELISGRAMDFCLQHIPGVTPPFDRPPPYSVLIQLASTRANDPLGEAAEALLADAFEAGLIEDAVLAASDTQANALWRLRESIPEAQKAEGGSIKNDISLPLSAVPAFIGQASKAVEDAVPGIRVVAFGHLGDGNIHFNLSQPVGADRASFMAAWDQLERIVSDIAMALGGSFSAEHGIGELKVDVLRRYKSEVALDLMRTIKRSLDPKNIMNPGKVIIDA